MFEQSLLESATHKLKTQVRWYFLITMIVYTGALSALIAGSTMLVSPQLKEQIISAALVMPPPPPPPPLARGRTQSTDREPSRDFRVPTKFQPHTSRSLSSLVEALPDVGGPGGSPNGVIGGDPRGISGGIIGGDPNGVVDSTGPITRPSPPPRREVETPPPVTPRRVSGGVLQGNAIRRVQPVYPPIARSARVSGPVEVEVVIDENGSVISATVVQGHPLLQQAALEAAWQWKFRPTRLSGVPIKVTGVLIFNFRL
jgi:protein TonB